MPTEAKTSPSGPLIDLDAGTVTSFITRIGAVVAVLADYTDALTTNDSGVAGATVENALDNLLLLQEFDFIIAEKDDFPAPSGGVITLVDGSYAITASVDLDTDHIHVDSGIEVLIVGMGPGKVLSTNLSGLSVIEFFSGSIGTLENLTIQNDNSGGYCFRNATDDGTLINCRFLGAEQGIRCIGGELTAIGCTTDGNTNGIKARGGEIRLLEHRTLNNTVGIRIDSAHTSITWVGGLIDNVTDGLSIEANLDVLHLNGISCINTGDFIDYVSGTVQRASVVHCSADTSSNAIEWVAASMPTLGLTLGHNTWNTAFATYNGFSEASARVNSKGDVDSGGLMSETPIVP